MRSGQFGLWISPFILLACIVGCKTSSPKQESHSTLMVLIREQEKMRGISLEPLFNEDNTYSILRTKQDKGNTISGDQVRHFLIVRLSDNQIILDEKVKGGSIKWLSNSEVEIFYPSGVPGRENRAIFNVTSGIKSTSLDNSYGN